MSDKRRSTTPLSIAAVTVAPLSVPTVDPFRIASGEVHATRSILVRVTLEREGERRLGLGEGACLPPVTVEDQPDAQAAVERAAPELAGQRFASEAELTSLLDSVLPARPVARSAIEVAVLDAWARLDALPLWRWLGGERHQAAPRIESDITLPILPPARSAELAASWWRRGFRRFKVKVGRAIDDDLAALEAIARAVPAAQLQPDANAGLELDEALRYARAVQALGLPLLCFEQPCRTLEELRGCAEALEAPVIADESVKTAADLDALLVADAADGINLKIAKTGSLLGCLALGRAARRAGLALMVGGMVETSLGMTAATHLAAALGGVELADLDTAWLLAEQPFTGGYRPIRDDGGDGPGPIYLLDESPGLGIEI